MDRFETANLAMSMAVRNPTKAAVGVTRPSIKDVFAQLGRMSGILRDLGVADMMEMISIGEKGWGVPSGFL